MIDPEIEHTRAMALVLTEHARRLRRKAQEMWAEARYAILDAQVLREMLQGQIEGLGQRPGFRSRYLRQMLAQVLASAIAESHSERGFIHRYAPDADELVMEVQQGLEPRCREVFKTASGATRFFHRALKIKSRVFVEDICGSEEFVGTAITEALLDAEVRSLQVTPAFDRRGEVVGVLTTLWAQPHVRDAGKTRMLDHYARCAGVLLAAPRNNANAAAGNGHGSLADASESIDAEVSCAVNASKMA